MTLRPSCHLFRVVPIVMFEFIRVTFCFIAIAFHCIFISIYVLSCIVMGYAAQSTWTRLDHTETASTPALQSGARKLLNLYKLPPITRSPLSFPSNHHCRLARHSFWSRFRFRVLVCTESPSCLQRFMLGQSALSYWSSIELSRLMGKLN